MATGRKGKRRKLKPLTPDEMTQALILVDEEHPLQHTLIYEALPFLKPLKDRNWLPNFIPH